MPCDASNPADSRLPLLPAGRPSSRAGRPLPRGPLPANPTLHLAGWPSLQAEVRDAEARAARSDREKEALERSMAAEIEELQAALQVGGPGRLRGGGGETEGPGLGLVGGRVRKG